MAEPNWNNRTVFHADNLDVMRGMNAKTVDLIATDPPFNKSRDFHATPDSLAKGASFQDRWNWDEDVHDDWVRDLKNKHPRLMEAIESAVHAHSQGMGAYMCFMAIRLIEMKRILKPTGMIFLHCDTSASHYLKACMDAVFGWKQFRNNIIWKRRAESHNLAKLQMTKTYDSILWYSASPKARYHVLYLPYDDDYIERHYNHVDSRGRIATFPCTNEKGGNTPYTFRGIKRAWRFSPQRMQALYEDGRLTQASSESPFRYKKYLSDAKGIKMSDLWTNIKPVRGKESCGYPTQKPLALYERIISAGSSKGDVVIDPFAGCATTCVAAERLGRKWAGIDIWKGAHRLVVARLQEASHSLQGGQVYYTKDPPRLTDPLPVTLLDDPTQYKRKPYGWEALKPAQIRERLETVQAVADKPGFIYCAACGRQLEQAFMQLEHIRAKSDGGSNFIDNRVLICGPCNRTKSDRYSFKRLRQINIKTGWTVDRDIAAVVYKKVIRLHKRIKVEMP